MTEMKKMMKIMSGIVLTGVTAPVVVGIVVVVLAVIFMLAAWVLSLLGIEPWPVPQ